MTTDQATAKELSIVAKIEAMLRKHHDKAATADEAATALLMAQRMALKHNIDISKLNGKAPDDPVSTLHLGGGLVRQDFRKHIVTTLAHNFRSEAVFIGPRDGDAESCMLIGKTSDLELIRKLFAFTIEVGEVALRNYLITQTPLWGNSLQVRNVITAQWGTGFFLGIRERFKKQVAEVPGMELMVITSQEVKDALNVLDTFETNVPIVHHETEHTAHGYFTGKNLGDPNDGLLHDGS